MRNLIGAGRYATRLRAALVVCLAAASLAVALPAAAHATHAVPPQPARPSAGKPVISLFSPLSGDVGTNVTIFGSGFTGAIRVTFNGTSASFTVISASQVKATVPSGARSGPLSITTSSGTGSSSRSFIVPLTLSVCSGPPTTVFTVAGSGFGANAAIDLYWEAIDKVVVIADSAGRFSGIQLQVPAAAVPGTYWVSAVERDNGKGTQAPFLVRTDWTMFHANLSHTGVNPYENVLNPATVSGLGLSWSYTTGAGIGYSSPTVVNRVAYIASTDGTLYALNATTGARLWSRVTGNSIWSSPEVVNGVVYIGSNDGRLYALNASTGSLLWT